jgi:hypothetical protein
MEFVNFATKLAKNATAIYKITVIPAAQVDFYLLTSAFKIALLIHSAIRPLTSALRATHPA